MLVVKLTWWLWNQMFQYAFIRSLSIWNNCEFLIDIHNLKNRPYWLHIFNIKEKFAKKKDIPRYENMLGCFWHNSIVFRFKWICKYLNPNHHFEDSNTILDKIFWLEMADLDKTIQKLNGIKSWYIEWIFQSELYFKCNKNTILDDFTFKQKISKKTKEIENVMKKTNSVWVHIRRGDYLQSYWSWFLWVKWIDYYNKCISLMKKKINNPQFFFISDDPERCKEQFSDLWNSYFIDRNNWEDSWQDMYLLSKCKHNIIWNSTFAWRWAYLNNNKNKIVIAPKERSKKNKKRYKRIIPNEWIKL